MQQPVLGQASESEGEQMQLEGMQPIGVIEIPAPEQPAFKVGDKVEIVGPCNYEEGTGYAEFKGRVGKIAAVDSESEIAPYRVDYDGYHIWYSGSSLKLLPPEPQEAKPDNPQYIFLASGEAVAIPMTRKKAMELGILNKKAKC